MRGMPVNALICTALIENHDWWDSSAEGVGFEPTVTSRPRRFSRPVPSTARPPLHDRSARTISTNVLFVSGAPMNDVPDIHYRCQTFKRNSYKYGQRSNVASAKVISKAI
jgi:hypothetical protein